MTAPQTQIQALQAAIKLLADAVSASVKAAGDATTAAKLAEYEGLLPDVLSLIPQIGNFSLSGLSVVDYTTLLGNLATDLALPAGKTAEIINASLKLIEDLALVIYPDVQALLAVINPPAVAVVAAVAAPAAPAAVPAT